MAVAKLKGMRVRDSSGKELGKINDFIIDGNSGKIAHVVISAGGVLGVGDKLRLLRATNLKQSGGTDFTADMAQTDFEALPAIAEKDLKAGRITSAATPRPSGSLDATGSSTFVATGHLVRAGQLKDKTVRSDDNDVGKIDSVVIDLARGEAMAVIEAKGTFAGQAGKYVVPLSRLEVRSEEADHISSSLMRSDFGTGLRTSAPATAVSSPSRTIAATSTSATPPIEAATASSSQVTKTESSSSPSTSSTSTPASSDARPSTSEGQSGLSEPSRRIAASTSPVASTTPSPVTSAEQLTPTGRSSAEQSPASGATAMAIRHALDQDETLARENVQVTTKVVLRGSVPSEEAKRKVEELAKQAANEAEIENQIIVQQK